jgi:hypothetical protein
VISLDLTCGCYEAVYADFEWDIVNVPSPSMTFNYLSVKLSVDTGGAPCDHLGLRGVEERTESLLGPPQS